MFDDFEPGRDGWLVIILFLATLTAGVGGLVLLQYQPHQRGILVLLALPLALNLFVAPLTYYFFTNRGNWQRGILSTLVFFLLAIGVVGLAWSNGALDQSEPMKVSYQVLKKRETVGKGGIPAYSLVIKRSGDVRTVNVDKWYHLIKPGDEVMLMVKRGHLGIPWIVGLEAPAAEKRQEP